MPAKASLPPWGSTLFNQTRFRVSIWYVRPRPRVAMPAKAGLPPWGSTLFNQTRFRVQTNQLFSFMSPGFIQPSFVMSMLMLRLRMAGATK